MTEVVLEPGPLPVGPHDKKTLSWWGVMCLIVTEAALFSYLEFSYYYFDVQLPHSWRPQEPPKLHYSLPDTLILIASSVFVWLGERAMRKSRNAQSIIYVLVGFLLGCAFLVIQVLEWKEKKFTPQSGPYGSLYFTITGFHMAHVVVGLAALLMVMVWSALGYFNEKRDATISNVSMYWHFVDAVWLTLFFMFYLSPRIW